MGIKYAVSREILTPLFLTLMLMTSAGYVSANNTMNQSQQLSVGQTMISPGKTFELGFFIPANSSKQYLGIWYKNVLLQKIVWVANRDNPLRATDSASSLVIGKDGNLRLLDGLRNPVWWTNVSVQPNNNAVAVLSENGDWILKDNISGFVLWESFNYPCDTFLPGMTIGVDTKTGKKHLASSWKSKGDPSPGKFVAGLTSERPPQAFIWNGSKPYWRSGPWDGGKFIGILDSDDGYANSFKLLPSNSLTLDTDDSFVLIMVLTPEGSLQMVRQDDGMEDIYLTWEAPENPCDVYGVCGPFEVCNIDRPRKCGCLKGFVPKYIDEWRKGNWGGGCVRRTELPCQRKLSSIAQEKSKADGFWKLKGVKLPDHIEHLSNVPHSFSCQQWCMSNCSCQAYTHLSNIGCMVWSGDLIYIQQFPFSGNDLFLRLAHSELGKDETMEKLIISSATISAVVFLCASAYSLHKCSVIRRAKRQNRIQGALSPEIMPTSTEAFHQDVPEDHTIQEELSELPLFEFRKILIATSNFNRANKLGTGGFGEVYKGKLENGQEVAVKRLSSRSGQGYQEFKNEIILISKLQHRNLVKLLGCCIEGEEKLLVYEYMTNRSLDTFLFDAKKRMQLDWDMRFKIINGTARGLLYLHRDSRLRVIHRDMKASNILLDDDMDAKISDFGLARTFRGTQDLANTQRVVGTLGYMSPEYAIGGLFSEKSDVFSFGVLLIEIISGTKNTSFYNQEKHAHLLGYAWQLWEEKKELDLLDQALAGSYTPNDVRRCIQIGLLCVQDHAADRPTMSAAVVMLSSDIELPQPKKPTFTFQSLIEPDRQSHSAEAYSYNELSTTIVEGR